MGDIYKDCYQCGKNCINTQFCLDGGSHDASSLSLPRSLKIRIVANPDFWGFGSISENTLVEGWGRFDEGHFDFFDGHEPNHTSLKSCSEGSHGPYRNEQRPDVKYRSVYDPENGDSHYVGTTKDGIIRGGAEAYLIDRAAEQTTDNSSCDTTTPETVFKTNPVGYGSYPKILFDSKIYKNSTGAWRIEECTGCYPTGISNSLRVYDCSGAPKQHIDADDNFAKLYDPYQHRCLADPFTGESDCNPDGTIASEYTGSISGILRDTGVSPFIQYNLQYNGAAASGIFNGQNIGIKGTSGNHDGVITAFDVTYSGGYTSLKAVGSNGNTDFVDNTGTWVAFDTYDPNTCCGGVAYGVDPALMNITNSTQYHIDIGRVFNNPKNKIYSNRIDRSYGGLTISSEVSEDTPRADHTYVVVNEDSNPLLVASGAIYDTTLTCETEIWSALGEYIYELDGKYSTASGVGSTQLATDSGFYPLKAKELPYYGDFYDVDRWDNVVRDDHDGVREKSRNATCYTKRGSLTVFPDCLTQSTLYESCDPKDKYTIKNVPRIGLLYRGCDYEDICTFDDSGRPWTAGASGHPSNMNDLIRGFGGQEIQMYINLDQARGAEIKRTPCCCSIPCPGTFPPEFVTIESPVTFPCFPKFDLYPEQYGCQDPTWYLYVMNQLGMNIEPSSVCADVVPFDSCFTKQPYTTYGFIRNLCGKETNSRRGVIDSLSTRLHTGSYRDTTPDDNTVEPMYVEFTAPTGGLCCPPTGYPTGGGCAGPGGVSAPGPSVSPSFDFYYGENASANLVITGGGSASITITAPGSGYVNGATGTVVGVTPNPTKITFTHAAANDGINAGTIDPSTGYGSEGTFSITIEPIPTGVSGSGGFSYDGSGTCQEAPYWGLSDSEGRLAYPYFRTTDATTSVCGTDFSYVDYDSTGTLVNGWPTSGVPFLVEIDHDDICTNCSVTQMPTGNLVLTVSSLSTKFAHHQKKPGHGSSNYGIYGWNHCAYPGTAITPDYSESGDSWKEWYCESGDGLALKYGVPYTGETCECADGLTVTMTPTLLRGANTPLNYTSSGASPELSYVKLSECDFNILSLAEHRTGLDDHSVYMKASLSCLGDDFSYGTMNIWQNPVALANANILKNSIYNCGEGCATSFPAVNSSPSLNLDFYLVSRKYEDIFNILTDKMIIEYQDFLENGLSVTTASVGPTKGNVLLDCTGCPPGDDDCVEGTGYVACNGVTGVFDCDSFTYSDCGDLTGSSPSSLADLLHLGHCVHDNPNKVEATTNIPGCLGSRIVLLSCTNWPKGVYNTYHGNNDGKFVGGPADCLDVGACNSFCDCTSVIDANRCTNIFAIRSGCDEHTYVDAWAAAYSGARAGDYSAICSLQNTCYDLKEADCCLDLDENVHFPPKTPATDRITNSHLGCWCDDINNYDISHDFTYSELTDSDGVKHIGWYGTPLSLVEVPGNCDNNAQPVFWSGENIPGLGNIGPLPFDPIAWKWNGDTMSNILGAALDTSPLTAEPLCNWHTGPNQYVNIGAELIEPAKKTYGTWGGTPHLYPPTCVNETGIDNKFYASCGTPKPFDTYGDGIGAGIQVNKKACWPEVMTVHKIECDAVGYKLHVSREYFEHNRVWTVLIDGEYTPKLGLTTGGTDIYRSGCGDYYKECKATGDITSLESMDYSFNRPLMTPSDTVAPLHPNLCATGTDVYFKTKTSYTGGTTDDTYCAANGLGVIDVDGCADSGCLLFPSISGQSFWNFHNLLPPGKSHPSQFEQPPDAGLGCNESYPYNLVDVGTIPYTNAGNAVFSSVSQLRGAHSCFQNYPECGGDLWCNKEFFPRRSYKANTKITKFAALSICTQTSEFEGPSWYGGHGTTWGASPNKSMLGTGPFIDACDPNVRVLAQSDIGIDDNIIYIPHKNSSNSSNSILTLMGVVHPGFKADVNEKTCIYVKSGECVDFLPEHTDRTIRDITFSTDEYGYYLDKTVASGSHDCLFTPFKIMVDVECCPDRIGHRGTTDPTNLNYVSQIPSFLCGGWVAPPPCDCGGPNSCVNQTGPYFPTLECLRAVRLRYLTSGEVPCNTGECFAITDDWWFADSRGYTDWLVDTTGNDPWSSINTYSTSGIINNVASANICGGSVCTITPSGSIRPEVISTGMVDPIINQTILEISGDYFWAEKTHDWHTAIFTYSGVKWAFDNHVPDDADSCCNGKELEDRFPPATLIGSRPVGIGKYNDGCDCDWSVCLINSTVNGQTANAHQLQSGVYFEDFDAPAGGINIIQLLKEFGCEKTSDQLPCSYPSFVKLNISEDI
jgi:hypothetical protein